MHPDLPVYAWNVFGEMFPEGDVREQRERTKLFYYDPSWPHAEEELAKVTSDLSQTCGDSKMLVVLADQDLEPIAQTNHRLRYLISLPSVGIVVDPMWYGLRVVWERICQLPLTPDRTDTLAGWLYDVQSGQREAGFTDIKRWLDIVLVDGGSMKDLLDDRTLLTSIGC